MIRRAAACALALMASGWPAAASPPVDDLRVWGIQPACFDYVFASGFAGADGRTVLSFNDRSGRTHFLRVGETLGDYRIAAYTAAVDRVYNESIKTWQERPAGRVRLTGADGEAVTLIEGRRLPWAGWTARVVSLESGLGWAVRAGDAFDVGTAVVAVCMVEASNVVVSAGGVTVELPAATDGEVDYLRRLWADNERRAVERERALAEAAAKQDQPRTPRLTFPEERPIPYERKVVPMPVRSAVVVGGTYRYPTRYVVIPAVWTSCGRPATPVVVVPASFESRAVGVGVSLGGSATRGGISLEFNSDGLRARGSTR